MRRQHYSVKSVFYVNYLSLNMINSNYKIFIPAHSTYFTNKLIYLTLLPNLFTNKASQVFLSCFVFSFCSLCLSLI